MSSYSSENRPARSGVSAVVIGRNEGDRLRSCLESVLPHVDETVYVDSGSTDGSAAMATSMGAHIIELSEAVAFTAARGRNVGWKRILERNPSTQYVQFVDGDCTLDESWISNALAEFAKHADVAIICGHVQEEWPTRNIYHRLAAMEWDTPTGRTKYCGGIAMIRTAALTQANGFRDDLLAGEEPEFCVRLRQAGWSILKLDHKMASHDCDIQSFGLWWKRAVRSGRAFAEGASLHGAAPERHWVKETRSIWIWGVAIPLLGVLLVWPTQGLSLAVMIAAYLLLLARIVIGQVRSRGRSLADASLYAIACVVGKWPQAVGLLACSLKRCARLGTARITFGECRCASKDVP